VRDGETPVENSRPDRMGLGFSLPKVRTKTYPLFSSAKLKHSIRHESGFRSQPDFDN
jgi:hypothetical protein